MLLFSCSGDKEPNPIIGKWIEAAQTDQNPAENQMDVTFLPTGEFIANGWYDQEIRGNWSTEKSNLTLNYIEPQAYQIDSITVVNSSDGQSQMNFYEEDELASTTAEGELIAVSTEKQIQINTLDENNLSFVFNGYGHNYTRSLAEERSLSFWSILRGAFWNYGPYRHYLSLLE